MNRESKLPKGWAWTRVGEIAQINPKFDESMTDDIEVTFLPMKCVAEMTGNLDLSLTRRLSGVRKGYTPFVEGDLLFAKITPCMENGKVAIAHGLKNGVGFGSTEFHVVRLPESFPRKFLFFLLIQEELRKDAKRYMTGTAGQLRVLPHYMKQIPIPLPPLPEQHRIVAKIEELLTRLDAGVEALKRVKAQLRAYRQAVLRDAFEGRLTAQWREAHRGEMEPASALLERIKEERSLRGAKRRSNPRDESEIASPAARNDNLPDLPALPQGWVWTRLGEIAELIRGVSYAKEESLKEPQDGHFPILRATNIGGELDFDDLVYVPSCRVNHTQLVRAFDILIAMSSGSKELVGKAAQAKHDFQGGFGAFCGLVRASADLDRKFVGFFFYSPDYRDEISRLSSGININNLRREHIESMPLPLPPLPEQHRIVEEIERRFSVADQVEKAVEQGLKQAQRLRQSILKRAFEGRLVPQDPTDEPAERLLERIRAERAGRGIEKRKGKRELTARQGRVM